MKMKNNILAIPTASSSYTTKSKIAAIIATTRKIIVHLSIIINLKFEVKITK
jgi:hypothetical protein